MGEYKCPECGREGVVSNPEAAKLFKEAGCPVCVGVRTPEQQKRFEREVNSGPVKGTCPDCGRTYTFRNELDRETMLDEERGVGCCYHCVDDHPKCGEPFSLNLFGRAVKLGAIIDVDDPELEARVRRIHSDEETVITDPHHYR